MAEKLNITVRTRIARELREKQPKHLNFSEWCEDLMEAGLKLTKTIYKCYFSNISKRDRLHIHA